MDFKSHKAPSIHVYLMQLYLLKYTEIWKIKNFNYTVNKHVTLASKIS